jgi:hypothetical protein
MKILKKVLIPEASAAAVDIHNINALAFALTWSHRNYGEVFPDDKSTLANLLHNFLAIPLQFTVTAVQWSNYSVVGKGLEVPSGMDAVFSLPNEMITRATSGSMSQRLVIQNWAGGLFIAATFALLLLVLYGIGRVLRLREPLPITSGIGDIDIMSSAEDMMFTQKPRQAGSGGHVDEAGCGIPREEMSLLEFTRDLDTASYLDLAKKLRDRQVRHKVLSSG